MNCTDVYKALWGEDFVDNTPVGKSKLTYCVRYKKDAKNSRSFDIDINYNELKDKDENQLNSVCLKIKDLFEIEEKFDKVFDSKFKEACSGSGNEIRKITTLHSSSLCALLFFYNVSKQQPLKIETIKEFQNVEFTNVYFEFKTHVIDYKHPSNMDVVLMGNDKNSGEKVCLFLESKFSEYLYPGRAEVGKSYWETDRGLPIVYDDELLRQLGLERKYGKDGIPYIFGSSEKCYAHGIKQMISHFIGVHNYLKNIPSKEKNQKLEGRELGNPSKVYLGEILFDFGNLKDKKMKESYFVSYSEKYKKLAEILNKKIENKYSCKFKLLEEVLSYNELKNYKKDESKIYNYYFGKNSK